MNDTQLKIMMIGDLRDMMINCKCGASVVADVLTFNDNYANEIEHCDDKDIKESFDMVQTIDSFDDRDKVAVIHKALNNLIF